MSRAGVIAGLLSLGLGSLVGASTRAEDNVPDDRPQPSSFGDPSESETTTASFSVEKIDPANRLLVVQSADGSRMTVRVDRAAAGLDELQTGDRVELDYYPATVLGFGADAPATHTQETPTRASAPPLGPAAAQVMTTRVRVASIDREKGTLQITTTDGQPQTLLVRGPAERRQLRSLRPGDTVVVTYPQPVAVGLRTAGST